MKIKATDTKVTLPGLASVHSHAFQRAMRGRTQRKNLNAGSFWSWRGLMYQLAEQIGPAEMYAIAKLAYTEMALSGVTLVGEFHYVHHDKDGRPYTNRTEMADAVIRAAQDVGIRICLIRTAYMRGGFQQELAAAQRRFSDDSVDLVLQDVETLRRNYAADSTVTVALAAHSVRTVPIEATRELAAYAELHQLPFHMHVCEQRRELDECMAEHEMTPIQLLDANGVLSSRFVGVHATHLSADEINALGSVSSYVNLCRTTERDLGDGLPYVSDMVAAGVKLCVGIDSHCCENAFEEIRAIESDERSRLEARTVVGDADFLLDVGTRQGYAAVGLGSVWQDDQLTLDRNHISIVGLPDENLVDGIIFGGNPAAVREVAVNGRIIVEEGTAAHLEKTKHGFVNAVRQLL